MAETGQDAAGRVAESNDDVRDEFWPQETQVLVRMYGQGIGDCFLLAIPRTRPTPAVPDFNKGRPVYVLIDCGVVARDASEPQDRIRTQRLMRDRMVDVVRDIRLTTRDETLDKVDGEWQGHLDLLIVTNSHWDHVSGFVEAAEEWSRIQVDALWTAWTERTGGDDVAEAVTGVTNKQRKAVAEIAKLVSRVDLDEHLGIVTGLASFVADAVMDAEPATADASGPTGPIAAVTERVPDARRVSCEPGAVRPLPGTHVNAYVLGPPRDWERLRTVSPRPRAATGGNGAQTGTAAERRAADPAAAVRRILDDPSPLNALAMPLLGLAAADGGAATRDTLALEDRDAYDRSFPFDQSVRVPLATAEAAAAAHGEAYAAWASYVEETSFWRRIDFDWLAGAVAFTLEANTLVNNTSLVLAFELPPAAAEQKVLLFASDAQLGNWASWDDIPAWKLHDEARPAQRQPNMTDLLQRTVFYKVSHHGSHNGTPNAIGLNRMRDDGTLTAFVTAPLDEAQDRKGRMWAALPHPDLLDALSARTGTRVVLSNGAIWTNPNGLVAARRGIGLEISGRRFRSPDDAGDQTERDDPLWVQIGIDY